MSFLSSQEIPPPSPSLRLSLHLGPTPNSDDIPIHPPPNPRTKRLRNGLSLNLFDEIDCKQEGSLSNAKDVMFERDYGFDMEGSIVRDQAKSHTRRFSREEKAKGVDFGLVDVELVEIDDHGLCLNTKDEVKGNDWNDFIVDLSDDSDTSDDDDEKEEEMEVVVVDSVASNDRLQRTMEMDVDVVQNVASNDRLQRTMEMDVDVVQNVASNDRLQRTRERFKNFARQNALKYAHFNDTEDKQEQENFNVIVDNLDDLVGPFSTAMKFIRDREKGMRCHGQNSKGGFPLVNWTPRDEGTTVCSKRVAPSLVSLCVDILVENVDAISSLRCVPDAIRNAISRKLCDSRKMNSHFFSLLLEGSPSEIRFADCSWLQEREFEESFEGCDTKKLMVLQLDLGGHCLSDSSLRKALIPKGLEALTTISLRGACRISDVGLAALVSSAPKLRSINLSQCTLLTDVGIESIANSLGSLQELYLDDCGTLDAMRILPMLKRLKSLEVLSLRGITSVSDKFIRELIVGNGHNMKELVLGNCVNLTDISLKIIAEKCSQLCVFDLSFLGKLTDIGMAYLANGCRGIQHLKLDHCSFSDYAIAAFLETSGDSLKELSLNKIKQVGQNTILSLARFCKNLESLDLSWCRSLTDEALGLIADSCLSLRLLKIFGCTQVTSVFVDGHSNPGLRIIGLKLTPILEYIQRPEFQQGA